MDHDRSDGKRFEVERSRETCGSGVEVDACVPSADAASSIKGEVGVGKYVPSCKGEVGVGKHVPSCT